MNADPPPWFCIASVECGYRTVVWYRYYRYFLHQNKTSGLNVQLPMDYGFALFELCILCEKPFFDVYSCIQK